MIIIQSCLRKRHGSILDCLKLCFRLWVICTNQFWVVVYTCTGSFWVECRIGCYALLHSQRVWSFQHGPHTILGASTCILFQIKEPVGMLGYKQLGMVFRIIIDHKHRAELMQIGGLLAGKAVAFWLVSLHFDNNHLNTLGRAWGQAVVCRF